MKKTNTTLARELAEAYAANLPHDEIREELEARGCPRLAIDAAFADNLAPSAVEAMDERQLDAALAAAARDMVEAMKRRAAAASLGRKGGRSRSAAKVAAVRANGAKGGRPRVPRTGETFAGIGQTLALRVVAVSGTNLTYDLIDRASGEPVLGGVPRTRTMVAAAGGGSVNHPVHYWVEHETGEVWHLLRPIA